MLTSFGRSHHLEKSGTYSFFSKTTFFYAHFPGVGVPEIILLNKGKRTTEEKTLLRRVKQGESSSSPWQQKNNMLWWGAECPPEQWKCYVCASTKVIGAEIRVRPERQHSLINRPSLNFELQRVILKWWGDIIWKQKDNDKDIDIWRTALKINPRDLCTSRHFYISDTWEQQSKHSLPPFNK